MFIARSAAIAFIFVSLHIAASSVLADGLSGPKSGSIIAPLKVFVATGDSAGQELDVAADRGMKPTMYVFLRHDRFDRPLARVLKGLEKTVIEAGNEGRMVTVFLTDDADKVKDHLPRVQMSLQFTDNSMAVYPDIQTGPEGWVIHSDAYLTVVVANQGKVVESFGYRSANESVLPELTRVYKKSMEPN